MKYTGWRQNDFNVQGEDGREGVVHAELQHLLDLGCGGSRVTRGRRRLVSLTTYL
jgi:hypothetical protein